MDPAGAQLSLPYDLTVPLAHLLVRSPRSPAVTTEPRLITTESRPGHDRVTAEPVSAERGRNIRAQRLGGVGGHIRRAPPRGPSESLYQSGIRPDMGRPVTWGLSESVSAG